MMYVKGVSFLKNLEKWSPVNQHRLWALLTGFYDYSVLRGAHRASADVLGTLFATSGAARHLDFPVGRAPTPSGSQESMPFWEPEN